MWLSVFKKKSLIFLSLVLNFLSNIRSRFLILLQAILAQSIDLFYTAWHAYNIRKILHQYLQYQQYTSLCLDTFIKKQKTLLTLRVPVGLFQCMTCNRHHCCLSIAVQTVGLWSTSVYREQMEDGGDLCPACRSTRVWHHTAVARGPRSGHWTQRSSSFRPRHSYLRRVSSPATRQRDQRPKTFRYIFYHKTCC